MIVIEKTLALLVSGPYSVDRILWQGDRYSLDHGRGHVFSGPYPVVGGQVFTATGPWQGACIQWTVSCGRGTGIHWTMAGGMYSVDRILW